MSWGKKREEERKTGGMTLVFWRGEEGIVAVIAYFNSIFSPEFFFF